MKPRAIVTSQPDIACYLCGRRLLRGEQPETFIVDASPQDVCELCAPRAAQQGWPRDDGEQQAVSEPQPPGHRRPGLFSRRRRITAPGLRARLPLERAPGQRARPVAAGSPAAGQVAQEAREALGPELDPFAPRDEAPPGIEQGLAAFNRGEYPRRIAGLARSLGAPEVSVALDEDLNLVTILVAWELCWYRYRVDLDEAQPQAQLVDEGRVLEQLPRRERLANALIDELGAVSLAAAAV